MDSGRGLLHVTWNTFDELVDERRDLFSHSRRNFRVNEIDECFCETLMTLYCTVSPSKAPLYPETEEGVWLRCHLMVLAVK
ncbi:unnamed protein product [Arctogadus glacialis]